MNGFEGMKCDENGQTAEQYAACKTVFIDAAHPYDVDWSTAP